MRRARYVGDAGVTEDIVLPRLVILPGKNAVEMSLEDWRTGLALLEWAKNSDDATRERIVEFVKSCNFGIEEVAPCGECGHLSYYHPGPSGLCHLCRCALFEADG